MYSPIYKNVKMKKLLFIFFTTFGGIASERSSRKLNCLYTEFKCSNSASCISNVDLCDGVKNCEDGSDETLSVCAPLIGRCPPDHYQCTYGACVKDFKQCGEKVRCTTSQESCAQCGNARFACGTGKCIPLTLICDGYADCDDGSDEKADVCSTKVCQKGEFRCDYGGCVKWSRKCDRINDCADGSDENDKDCLGYNPYLPIPGSPAETVTEHLPTLQPVRPELKDSCTLPPKPDGGDYSIVGCEGADCFLRAGEKVGPLTKLNYVCFQGYQLSEKYQSSYCSPPLYTWDPDPPTCLKTCKSLASESLDLECFYKGGSIPCNSTILPGTILRARCKSAYYLADPSSTFNETYCLNDGNWEKHLFKCNIYCGKPFLEGAQPTIAGGSKSKVGQFPWHAGLYFKTPTGYEKPSCGGSVITPYIVLTAAHCVFYTQSAVLRTPESVKVAVGKYWGDWSHHEQHEQKRDVRQIVPHTNYEGNIDKYLYDIALINLKESISLNNIVHPICLDWQMTKPPKRGEMGVVSGWGESETDTSSPELLYIKLKYLDHKSCREKVSTVYSPYVTIDKFCTENELGHGSGVLFGDSGGGWSLPRGDRYYIYGIVSVKPDTNNTQDRRLAGFTSVLFHLNWIQTVESSMNEARRYENQKQGILLTYK